MTDLEIEAALPRQGGQARYWRDDLLAAPYWNRRAETMPRVELDTSNLPKLRSLLRFARSSSRFYRELWADAGFDPDSVTSVDDFHRRAPVTDKADFLGYQTQDPPYGRTLALGEEFLAHHSATSGTSGTPFNIPFSAYDTERYGESWVYGWWALGIRPTDVFYFAFNWGRYAGFWSAYWGARRLGAKVVSGGGLSTEEHVDAILRERPTVLIATPSFALRIAANAESRGLDLSGSSIRFTYHAGEPGPCSLDSLREQLDRAYGATSGELLGVAELDAMAPGCPGRRGVHMNELNSVSWSRDPRTGAPCGDGEIGENVVTTFVNNAQPLINYNTHDLVRAYRRDSPCGCGRTWRYLDGVVLGRSDHMVTVRGTNVYPSAVENVLHRVEGASQHFQIVLSHDDLRDCDEVAVRIEPHESWPSDRRAAVGAAAETALRAAIGLRMPVEVLDPGVLPRSELKARRILDLRPAGARRELDRR
jgi:phenylacetate-CoA ligase